MILFVYLLSLFIIFKLGLGLSDASDFSSGGVAPKMGTSDFAVFPSVGLHAA